MLGMTCRRAAALAFAVSLGVGIAGAAEVVRTPLPDGNPFPISAAVTVPAGYDTVYVSGALPTVVNKDAPKGSVEAYGDMAAQAESALANIKASLAKLGLGMGDVVKMTVFMVADPTKDNKLDFAGLMAGYTKFFGTAEQPNKPARSAVQVAALVAPGALVEIEAIAVKPHKTEAPAGKAHKSAH
ncbi:MAG TPA: RidA family protein [Steroidobacteraceae bacterium]|nr:RidA family protein [Steroidobacteraceae bacterium]